MNALIKRYLKKFNFVGLIILTAYVFFISWRLFFYAYSDNYRGQMSSISYNLVPFKTIANYLINRGNVNFDVWIYNLAGNVAAFMPLGFLLPFAFRGMRAVQTYIAAFILILTAEVLQLISRRGVFDVDDLLLNMLGCMIGYGIYKFLYSLFKGRR